MTFTSLPLFAQDASRIVFRWGRVESNADWVLPLCVFAAVALFARQMIRLDTRELNPILGWSLTALRIGAILFLLILYLQPQWRSEQELVRNSRVFLLVDTSSSMGLADVDSGLAGAGSSRAEQVAAGLGQTDFIQTLRGTHDVVVLRFDKDVHRLAELDKLPPPSGDTSDAASDPPGDNRTDHRTDEIQWKTALTPTGSETRLGHALKQLVHEERNSPLSGIVVFSDGGQNAGTPPQAAVEAALEAKVPIFTVGVGSKRQAVNVRVDRFDVPPQAYPGDPYSVSGLIRAQGMAGETVSVELLLSDAEENSDSSDPGAGTPVHREDIILGGDGEAVPVKFELTPSQTGRANLCLRVLAPETDSDPTDNSRQEEIRFVDRKTRVLLFAGGPTREYRFLRTQLFRDASITVDVLLQTGQPGISQEAEQILDQFPSTRKEMYVYDCLVAFDPNWSQLDPGQVDLLDTWIAEQGGGLIAIAGPVHAGEPISGWTRSPEMAKIRALYPVEFQRHQSVFDDGAYVSSEPWPMDFTREGLEAEYIWLADTSTANQQIWNQFDGVYSYQPVSGPKPGATVLANFADPRAAPADRQAVYLAEQFYGSGRVFYLGSGEMWRLRRVDQTHFTRFYLGLIRHVSQGRALRQSSRGTLMVGQDRYVLGSSVPIRARLTNAQLDPLEAPAVELEVIGPNGSVETVTLRPDGNRAGMYAGQLTVIAEGTYRLELPIPRSDERIARHVKVELPDLEREKPELDDALLGRIADDSKGRYYHTLEAALAVDVAEPLVGQLKDRTKTVVRTGSLQQPSLLWLLERWLPGRLSGQDWFYRLTRETWLNKLLDQTLLWWLIVVTCTLLCLEWLIRRLSKLA